MLQTREQEPVKPPTTKKLRTACDVCHQAKMKCSGGTPCLGCRESGYECCYSVSNRIGRPKGTKNKRTLDRMSRRRSEASDKTDSGQASPIQAQSSMATLTSPTATNMSPIEKPSIESVLGGNTDGPNSFPESETFGPFSEDLTSWYDFSDFAASSPFTQQPSSTTHFSNDESASYSNIDSAYVSPGNLFNDKAGFDSALDLGGVLGNMDGETEERQNMTMSPSSSSLASMTTCNCVQNHAELLCRLKELEQRHAQPRLDVVLSSAQQALVPWKSVIECPVCRHDENQEVLILSALSIRTVLRSLQSLCSEHYNSVASGQDSYDQQQPAAVVANGMHSAIGMYEITGEERMAVKNLLISRTLDKMKYTLACFKERLETLNAKKVAAAGSCPSKISFPNQSSSDVERLHQGGPGNLDHLVKVWRNLDSTVQMLERVLKSGNIPNAKKRAIARKYLAC